MDLLESLFGLFRYAAYAFAGGLGLLVVLALVFGKRIEKKWEYEAKFRDERGREVGEFDIELYRVIEDKNAATQPDFTLKAKFVLRHPTLTLGQRVQVSLVGEPVFDATVLEAGRLLLRAEDLLCEIKSPEAGQLVSVEVAGAELFSEPLRRD